MKNIFNSALTFSPGFHVFDRPNSNKLTYDFGEVIPVYRDFLHPGERTRVNLSQVTRFATLARPVFHQYNLNFISFFVPSRLIGYEDFFNPALNSEGELALKSLESAYSLANQYILYGNLNKSMNGLWDYLGCPMFPKLMDLIVDSLEQFNLPYYSFREGTESVFKDVSRLLSNRLKYGNFSANWLLDSYIKPKLVGTFTILANQGPKVFQNLSVVEFASQLQAIYMLISLARAEGEPVSIPLFDICSEYKIGAGKIVNPLYPSRNWYPIGMPPGGVSYDSEALRPFVFSFWYFLQCYCQITHDRDYEEGFLNYSPDILISLLAGSTDYEISEFEVFSFYKDVFEKIGFSFDYDESATTNVLSEGKLPEDMTIYDLCKLSYPNLPALDVVLDEYYNYLKCVFMHIQLERVSKFDYFTECDFSAFNYTIHYDPSDEYKNDMYIKSYWKCISDWFIDTNLVDSDEFYESKFDENGVVLDWKPFRRLWPNDYFTSAFGSPQSGSAVNVPTSGTIEDFWSSERLQSLKEKIIWTGKRAIDQIRAVFGVTSSNARLDRTEIINYVRNVVDINTVVQTAPGNGVVGDLSANALSFGHQNVVDYFPEEQGIIMVMAVIQPIAEYMQGVDRSLLDGKSLYDFIMPSFADLGEQPIYASEVFNDCAYYFGDTPTEIYDKTYAWQRRYAQYMYRRDEIHGRFLTSERDWHSARFFDNYPYFGMAFKSINPNLDNFERVFAVRSSTPIFQYLHFSTKTARPLPKYITFSH